MSIYMSASEKVKNLFNKDISSFSESDVKTILQKSCPLSSKSDIFAKERKLRIKEFTLLLRIKKLCDEYLRRNDCQKGIEYLYDNKAFEEKGLIGIMMSYVIDENQFKSKLNSYSKKLNNIIEKFNIHYYSIHGENYDHDHDSSLVDEYGGKHTFENITDALSDKDDAKISKVLSYQIDLFLNHVIDCAICHFTPRKYYRFENVVEKQMLSRLMNKV